MKNHELFENGQFIREFTSNHELFSWLRANNLEIAISPKVGGWEIQTEKKEKTKMKINPGFEFSRNSGRFWL